MDNKNSSAKIAANNRYTQKTYDRINLAVPKGQKQIIETHAAALGLSVNGYIKEAINEKIEREALKHE
ncbi:hypothetical protein [Anaerotignum lactatifermentans]|uniref:hypothetical protein n=1 Tax=Anaerotignum lactatifermentans TaxID=160404 RepID=UPI002675F7DC|nr:hypothetical protein [Anaerotignum lactatifermentans]